MLKEIYFCKSKIKMSNEVTNFFLDLPRDEINIFSRMDVWMYYANFLKKLKLLPLMGQKNKKN